MRRPISRENAEDELRRQVDELADLTLAEAERLETHAEAVAGLTVIADGLSNALDRAGADDRLREPATRFVTTVRSAGERASEAAGTARRATARVLTRSMCTPPPTFSSTPWSRSTAWTAQPS